jgi:type II secretory pathway predicted ATPase ExeA
MFTQYYGIKYNPFAKEINERDLYLSKDFNELASRLEFMKKTRGLFLLTAESGAGKTTALRRFASSLNPGLYRVCYTALASVTVMDFYRGLILKMGENPEYTKVMMFEQLQRLVDVSYHEKRITPVFILDEAQSLSGSVLEDIRMLFNFKMDSENPFILIFAGQNPIRRKLQLGMHQALRQRITGNYHMKGLGKDEIPDYITARLTSAGAASVNIFTATAAEALYTATNGITRPLCNLVTASMTHAFAKKARIIDEEIVYQAGRDIEI